MADETRLRILNILKEGEMCVCEIETILDVNQSNASRHLNKLSNAGIIEYKKAAKYVYYKINDDILCEYPFVSEIIKCHTAKLKQCMIDIERLGKYKAAGLTCDDISNGKLKKAGGLL